MLILAQSAGLYWEHVVYSHSCSLLCYSMCDKINVDCSVRVNRSWTFEIPKSAATVAATATMAPTPQQITGRPLLLGDKLDRQVQSPIGAVQISL